jgi:hypothetical protein
MAHFIAYQAVNMNDLPGLHGGEQTGNVLIATGAEIEEQFTDPATGDTVLGIAKSVPGHPFKGEGGGAPGVVPVVGGLVSSFTVYVNGSLDYKITGLAVPMTALIDLQDDGNFTAARNLVLAGNNTIAGSHFNDVLVGGPGHNTFVFAKPFGHDVITNFSTNDKIEISHKVFANFEAVQDAAHVDAHHHVVITADASDTITLNTVHHVSDLTSSEFLFV